MSLIAKLLGYGSSDPATTSTGAVERTRSSSSLGVDRVRILLFRECEWRGRKLLFDSKVAELISRRCHVENRENNNSGLCRNNYHRTGVKHTGSEDHGWIGCEHGKLLSEDISQLGEMIFGTVGLTYKGPSFKIHAPNTNGCLMCTKVFPFAEHSICRQSDRHSSELLNGFTTHNDNNSSNSSLRTHSRPGSGNLSGNSLSPTLRKNSTCSSTGSGWDIDVPRLSSSHSLDGSSSNLASNGSLASLRRRWVRVMSTSLSRNEFDDSFNHENSASYENSPESHQRIRHKTRLGLAMLIQLPNEQERTMGDKLLEHVALLEGMLDHLRHSCIACKGPERSLVNRLYQASSSCTLRLLNFLLKLEQESSTPLVWHDLLLNSPLPSNVQINHIYRSMHQMCQLLEEYDAKSTNFFLSTIVTAVLTHHLGWVHSAPPRNRQVVDGIGNPLWAQLNDLCGALGTPARIAHTVIAGEPEKANLIESVLKFLSYFLRSGIIEKRQESRDPSHEDVQEAIAIIERTVRKNPSLEQPSSSWSQPSLSKRNSKTPNRRTKNFEMDDDIKVGFSLKKSKSYEEPRKSTNFESDCGDSFKGKELESKPSSKVEVPEPKEETLTKNLKRSGTLNEKLNDLPTDTSNSEDSDKNESVKVQTTSKVKIIVSDEGEEKIFKDSSSSLQELGKVNKEIMSEQKLTELRRKKLSGFKNFDWSTKSLNGQIDMKSNFLGEISPEVKSQVFFTLGGEEKTKLSIRERLKSACKCQCSYTFTRVPSTSAELPEGVLRKILQRNFPESSKNIISADCENEFGVCIKCRRGYSKDINQSYESKLLLETPTNATEVLKGCNSTARSTRVFRSNSLEALIEANCVIELPMPRSKKILPSMRKKSNERVGFSKSLISTKTLITEDYLVNHESGYTWGMVVQGFTKKKKKGRRRMNEKIDTATSMSIEEPTKIKENDWWWPIQEALNVEAKFPLIDQPVSEVLCILGDLDNWQVGLVSSNSSGSTPIPVGMSSLVSNMLEAFVYMWKEIRSPEQCIKLLESRLREMWLRSETLAEFLLAADLDDASVGNLTSFLDVEAADLPLLLAVATTHTPQIAQRFGLTLA